MRWRIAGVSALVVMLLGVIAYVLLPGETGVGSDNDTQAISSSQQIEAPTSLSLPPSTETNPWTAFALVLMSAATLVSISITFYLYKWRRILLGQPNLLLPEDWGKHLDGLGQDVKGLSSTIGDRMGLVSQETARNSEQLSNMIQTFMTLQKAIDERDDEIKRLKQGYDADVFRKFLNRFIRVDQLVDTYRQSIAEESESLGQIKRLMEDALDECGVESFQPNVGDDSRRSEGISDSPKTVKTAQKEDAFKIVEVIEPGYRLRGGISSEVLIPASVRISVFENE